MNFLIVGLGNIGDEYARTRHNIGFRVLDALAGASNIVFEDKRYGFVTTLKVKNQTLILLKPSTYMNLSGNAVRYWMNEKKIPVERVLVVCDDLALPFGKLRLKPSGSEAGHNGLRQRLSARRAGGLCARRVWRGGRGAHGGTADYCRRGDQDVLPFGHTSGYEPI